MTTQRQRRGGCYQCLPAALHTTRGVLPTHEQAAPENAQLHTAGQYLVACLITITNEVLLQILSNRGTNAQMSSNLVEYGIIRRRHRRIIQNNQHLHRHLHRRILCWNLALHAHRHPRRSPQSPPCPAREAC